MDPFGPVANKIHDVQSQTGLLQWDLPKGPTVDGRLTAAFAQNSIWGR